MRTILYSRSDGLPLRAFIALVALLSAPSTARTQPATPSPQAKRTASEPAVLLREVFVPQKAFEALKALHPEGIIMDLAEYRQLVLLALKNSRAEEPPALPPLEAAVLSAKYRGRLQDDVVRVDANLQVQLTRDRWVFVDLGPPLPALGEVLVDGNPGWVIVESPDQARSQAALIEGAPQSEKAPGERAYLLLQGKGEHHVELAFTLPVRELGEENFIETTLIPAPGASFVLEVPGQAEGKTSHGTLRSEPRQNDGKEATLLTVSLSSVAKMSLHWQARRGLGENRVLLSAQHLLAVAPQAQDAEFVWDVNVRIRRQKTDTLVFTTPENATITHVAMGGAVHAWDVEGRELRITLREPLLGDVGCKISGILGPRDGGGISITSPILNDAYWNHGTIGIRRREEQRVTVTASNALTEVARDEGSTPSIDGAPTLDRTFVFSGTESRLELTTTVAPVDFSSHATLVLRLGERTADLHARYQVRVREGRLYELAWQPPAAWRLVHLVAADESNGLSYEEESDGTVRMRWRQAARAGKPLVIEAAFEHTDTAPERNWDQRDLNVQLPSLPQQERVDLALALSGSLDLITSNLPDWKTLSPEEANFRGLLDAANLSGNAASRLATVLTSDATAPSVAMSIGHRPSRGEYRAVTHILAAEKRMRFRTDLRVAVVDRGAEELLLTLPPLPDDLSVIVLGDGIKETVPDNAGGQHRVRFERPWVGAKELRVEYELPRPADAAAATPWSLSIPDVQVGNGFLGDRFLVFQSRGAVEIETRTGPGLVGVEIDDIPDFARAWKEGRVLGAYRFQSGEPGTLSAQGHPGAPILPHLAPHMVLRTMVAADGARRSEAEFLLAYADLQSLKVDFPEGTRPLAIYLDSDPVTEVETRDPADTADGPWDIAISLPPKSYSTVRLLFEQAAGGASTPDLGTWGSWRATAPILVGVPIGETTWHIYHPNGYRFYLDGGNVVSLDPEREQRPSFFAESFFGRLLSGAAPLWTTWQRQYTRRPTIDIAQEEPTAPGGDAPNGGPPAPGIGDNRVSPVTPETQQGFVANSMYEFQPQGRQVRLSKVGGDAVATFHYLRFDWWQAARRAVFTLTLVVAVFLHRQLRARMFWSGMIATLFVATLFPYAIGWESPLFLLPLCEALVAASLGILAYRLLVACGLALAKRMSRWQIVQRWLPMPSNFLTLLIGVGVVTSVLASGVSLRADEAKPPAWKTFDTALITYGKDPEDSKRVYVPKNRFRELWEMAHPTVPEKTPQLDYAYKIGSVRYELRLTGPSAYALTGKIPLQVYSDRWTKVALPFDRAQLVRVRVDGVDRGVSQDAGGAFIELHGAKRYQIEVDLVGEIERELGVYAVGSRLLKSVATTLVADLPAGAHVRGGADVRTLVDAREDGTRAWLDLGSAEGFALEWRFPEKGGQQGSQLRSLSYSALSLDRGGYDIGRREVIEITGREVEEIAYEIHGDWQISNIEGEHVSEWNVTTEEGQGPQLRVFFSQPVKKAVLGIYGRGLLEDRATLATLALVGAVKQESYFALHHGEWRRFHPDTLSTLSRESYAEAARLFALPTASSPDRLYHAYSSGADQEVVADDVRLDVELVTDAIALLRSDSAQIFVRTRYAKAAPGPLRFRMAVPAGWEVANVPGGDWEVVQIAGARWLEVRLEKRVQPGREIIWSAEWTPAQPGAALDLPFLRTERPLASRYEESVQWVLAAEEQLELNATPSGRWERVQLDSAPQWVTLPAGTTYRQSFRSKRAEGGLTVSASEGPSQVRATCVSFARLTERFLHVNAHLNFNVRQGGEDTFRVRLPAGAELVSLETRNQRSRSVVEENTGHRIELLLQSPVSGEHAVSLLYRIPRSAGEVSELTPLTVLEDDATTAAGVDHFVGVVHTARTHTLDIIPVGLETRPANTLAVVPDGISSESLRATFVATVADWRLGLREEQVEIAKTTSALILMADLTTVVGNDGTRRTRVLYTLRNQGLQFLSLDLPLGARLWRATVNGRSVAVAKGASTGPSEGVRIPLENSGRSELPVDIALHYEEPPLDLPGVRGTSLLEAPRIPPAQGVRVQTTMWSVQLPGGYSLTESGGMMRPVLTSEKHAEKLQQLLDEKAKVLDMANNARSRRERERAGRDLARLEQALGDNLAELELTDKEDAKESTKELFGQQMQQQQQFANRQLIEKAQAEKKSVAAAREEQAKTQQQTPDEQFFDDQTRFLEGRKWRGADGKVPGESQASTRTDYISLLQAEPFEGWRGRRLPAAPPEADTSSSKPVVEDGLEPLRDRLGTGSAPAVEMVEGRPGSTTYTFRHNGGEGYLELTLSRQGSFGRLAAAALLLVAAGAAVWWRRRANA